VHAVALRLAVITVLALLAVGHATAPAAPSAAEVTLLAPANGARVVNVGHLGSQPPFVWRIDSAPAPGPVVIVLRTATDPELTQNANENVFSCPGTNLNCRTSFRPNRIYQGTWYWRVTVSGGVNATSETWSFTGIRQGGGRGADRVKPKVRALAGVAQRGQTAFFAAKVGDDSGVVRLRAALLRRGHEVARALGPFRAVRWNRRQTLFSSRPLPRGATRGAYRLCVTAWDRAGNAARSCAPYRVR
jgi:hypothetical protein